MIFKTIAFITIAAALLLFWIKAYRLRKVDQEPGYHDGDEVAWVCFTYSATVSIALVAFFIFVLPDVW